MQIRTRRRRGADARAWATLRPPRDFRVRVTLCVCGARHHSRVPTLPLSAIQQSNAAPTAPLDPTDRTVVSVVIPCLNEEENIERCVELAIEVMQRNEINGEVVVVDNATEDRSSELAAAAGARGVHEPRRGYGSAYLAGFAAARGAFIVMADADLTYDFNEIPHFVAEVQDEAQ